MIDVTNEFPDIAQLGYNVIKISGKDEMKPYEKFIWNILQSSYKTQGGYKSYNNARSMRNGYKFAYLCMSNDIIVACAIYRDKVEGNKRVGVGHNDEFNNSKTVVRYFIQHDIKRFKEWYWVEASGPVETLCKKYNGYPIPKIYAPEILLSQDLILEDDTLHYTRTIGSNEDEYTKCIFGFKSENMYNKIIQDMDGKYEIFRKDINHINESILLLETNTLLYKAKYIYEAFWKMHYEEGYNEITPKLYRLLKHAVTILNRNKEQVQYLGNIEEILNDFVILELHKFKK